jgi:tetratricopeptide (TPR) repeat protein
VRTVVCLLSIACVSCAGRHPVNVTPDANAAFTQSASADSVMSPADSLEVFMAKVRKLSAEARPERPAAITVESRYPSLAAAVAAATLAPSPATYREAAEEYRIVGIFDKAFQYLGMARTLDSRDAATYDALARLWRDSGFPGLALGDATRAAYFAPGSPVAHNTLGTIFQALGRKRLARGEYERALQLDPLAAYALNNLCYNWVLEGHTGKAVAACERALRLQPGLLAARNNLGLARAVGGSTADVRTAFAGAGDRAAELYNAGIVYLARGEYAGAVDAFDAALAVSPTTASAARLRQARAALAGRHQ